MINVSNYFRQCFDPSARVLMGEVFPQARLYGANRSFSEYCFEFRVRGEVIDVSVLEVLLDRAL